MVFEHENYRDILKSWMADKSVKNPNFSLRAMARHLSVNPTFLSEVLRGKKNLSVEMAHKISQPLGFNQNEKEYFFCLVEFESTKSMTVKSSLIERATRLNPNRTINKLTLDSFRAISEWHHLAILQLIDLSEFKLCPQSASAKLGISIYNAEIAILRLHRLGLIEKDETGVWSKSSTNIYIESENKNDALRKFHRQLLEKAIGNLGVPPQEKMILSSTYAIDPEQIDEAKSIIRECRDRLEILFSRGKRKTKIYSFLANLFELK